MSKTFKIILIVICSLVGLCLIFGVISMFFEKSYFLASTYGVTDKTKSALVIHNQSVFYIIDVELSGDVEYQLKDFMENGSKKVYTISPGTYDMSIHFCDDDYLGDLQFGDFYVSRHATAEFTVSQGEAVIFTLFNGKEEGIYYDPPNLVRN